MAAPQLDLTILDSHNPKLLVIADSSVYPTGWNIISPTMGITVPGYAEKQIPFVPQDINIYNSNTLGITCDVDTCALQDLPDGIYTFKYVIAPALTYNVRKNILRVDRLYSKFDEKFLNLEIFTCDGQLRRNQKMLLDDTEFYIQGAISAGNRCANKLALELYQKAWKLLDKLSNKTN
jgi:hypothetical protein